MRNPACKGRMRHPKYGCLTDASASKKRMRHAKYKCLIAMTHVFSRAWEPAQKT